LIEKLSHIKYIFGCTVGNQQVQKPWHGRQHFVFQTLNRPLQQNKRLVPDLFRTCSWFESASNTARAILRVSSNTI
jgi:hypothetical protein